MNVASPAPASRPVWRRLLRPALVIATLALVFGWLLPQFKLPVVAIAVLLITGEVNGTILLAGGISLIVTIVAGIAGYFFLRGERSARRLGGSSSAGSRGFSSSSSATRSKPVPIKSAAATSASSERSESQRDNTGVISVRGSARRCAVASTAVARNASRARSIRGLGIAGVLRYV